MSANRYYFPNFIEDDTLSILAVQAKELLQQNDKMVKIFEVNNEFLYGHSPRQVLFLMKQNNKSIFSSSPSNELRPNDEKAHQRSSTPVARKSDTSNKPRKYLPLDDAEKKVCHFATMESSTPVRRQTVIVSSKDNAIQIPNINVTVTSDEQVACPIGSKSSHESGNEESPRSAEIAKMTANLTITEKELERPEKVVASMDTCTQECPRSDEISMLSASFTTGEKGLESPEKVDNTHLGKKDSPLSTEIIKMTSSLIVDDKESGSLIQDDQIADSSATNTYSPNTEVNTAKYKPDSMNKEFITHPKGIVTISESTIIGNETPIPLKRSKMSSISTLHFQESTSLDEKVRMADSSSEDTAEIESCLQGDKLNGSPNEASKGITSGERKRKSPSPRKVKNTLFKSIPRVIPLAGKAEIDIEIPCDLEDTASPTTSQSSSTDYRSDLRKDKIKNPIMDELKPETSPKINKPCLHPSENSISPGSVSATKSPGSDDDFTGKFSSDISLVEATATREKSGKLESSSIGIETDPFSLNFKMQKFKALLFIRDQFAKRMFCSLLIFQNNIQFLSSYVNNVKNIVLEIGVSDKEYLTKELKDSINDARSMAVKLEKKLKTWKTDLDLDFNTWQKCIGKIQRLKAQYEPLLTKEGQPAVAFEVVQVYEFEMKSIWIIIDDMIMMGDTRRALFSHIAHDVENLMKIFVQCLILVGILHPR
ncbi:unnamed protein product [Larinioides sclopetarius]|uniref:Uncharacterized protein n=1 Tax=Larinioides sclopetarius TaxID=280406 RepID=A0AAV1ZL70_9ARAC